MAKNIIEHTPDFEVAEGSKYVEIQHLLTKNTADGTEVEVIDYNEIQEVNNAILNCENLKAKLEQQLASVDSDLTALIAIRDAE